MSVGYRYQVRHFSRCKGVDSGFGQHAVSFDYWCTSSASNPHCVMWWTFFFASEPKNQSRLFSTVSQGESNPFCRLSWYHFQEFIGNLFLFFLKFMYTPDQLFNKNFSKNSKLELPKFSEILERLLRLKSARILKFPISTTNF